jgi:hypothetical protein
MHCGCCTLLTAGVRAVHAVRAVQAYEGVEEAQKLAGFYKLFELPALLIIDPVTGKLATSSAVVATCVSQPHLWLWQPL